MRLGFHVSISGGFSLSVQRAFELGCTCMQIFSRNPRGWTVKPLDKDDIAEFKKLRVHWDIGPEHSMTLLRPLRRGFLWNASLTVRFSPF